MVTPASAHWASREYSAERTAGRVKRIHVGMEVEPPDLFVAHERRDVRDCCFSVQVLAMKHPSGHSFVTVYQDGKEIGVNEK